MLYVCINLPNNLQIILAEPYKVRRVVFQGGTTDYSRYVNLMYKDPTTGYIMRPQATAEDKKVQSH